MIGLVSYSIFTYSLKWHPIVTVVSWLVSMNAKSLTLQVHLIHLTKSWIQEHAQAKSQNNTTSINTILPAKTAGRNRLCMLRHIVTSQKRWCVITYKKLYILQHNHSSLAQSFQRKNRISKTVKQFQPNNLQQVMCMKLAKDSAKSWASSRNKNLIQIKQSQHILRAKMYLTTQTCKIKHQMKATLNAIPNKNKPEETAWL